MIRDLATLVEEARHVVALTGAGVSTESGIPDFRSDAGLWQDADPMDVSSIEGFEADPERFYAFWKDKFASLVSATPNDAHRLLAGLESRGRMAAVITQNIDGLHQRAGSSNVHEVHGSFRTVHCLSCGYATSIEELFAKDPNEAARCPRCDAKRVKPDVVLFGEMLPPAFGAAQTAAREADLLIAMGSSLAVYPVAGLVGEAQHNGAKIAILNRESTPFDDDADLVIHGELGKLSRELMTLLGVS